MVINMEITGMMYDWKLEPETRKFFTLKGKKEFEELEPEIKTSISRSEFKTVEDGTRKCATLTVNEKRLNEELQYLSDLDLIFLPKNKCKLVDGFSHKFYRPQPGEPTGVYGVVARNYEDGREFIQAEEENDHGKIGELLGYPECCLDHFGEIWPEEFDPVWTAAKRTEGAEIEDNAVLLEEIDPETNPLLRYWGLKISPHLPCSYRCEESVEFGAYFLEYIDRSDFLRSILSGPIEWNCYKGIAEIKTPWFHGITDSLTFKKPHKIIIGDRVQDSIEEKYDI